MQARRRAANSRPVFKTNSTSLSSTLAPVGVLVRASSADAASWTPQQREELEKTISKSLVSTLQTSVQRTLVPWYLRNFPSSYFSNIGESTRMAHLKGLSALAGISNQSTNAEMTLSLVSDSDEPNLTDVTVSATHCSPGKLHKQLLALRPPFESGELRRIQAYSSHDYAMSLHIFSFGDAEQQPVWATMEDAEPLLKLLTAEKHSVSKESVEEFVKMCGPSYMQNLTPSRYFAERKLYESVCGTEGVELRLHQDGGNPETAWISMAAANVLPEVLLTKVTAFLAARGLNILRMHFDLLKNPTGSVGSKSGTVSMINIMVEPVLHKSDGPVFQNDTKNLDTVFWHGLGEDLRRIKWLNAHTLDLAVQIRPELGLARAEVLTAMCAMLHGPLSKLNSYAFSRVNLLSIVGSKEYCGYASDIADLFLARFNPHGEACTDFDQQVEKLQERIRAIADESARTVLLKMVDAVRHTRRTNMYVPGRCALALRVDPELMIQPGQEDPFGVFFIHGERFDGFHNRFLNIARGGLRIVTPNSSEQFAIESSRCYDEVYGLSRAQQLKNKDIPEGGAKAVVLVDVSTSSSQQRYHAMRTSVKAFTDSLLDLIVSTELTRKHVVDWLGFDELVYLGPDEQVVPEDIDWIISQAARRGYPIPAAFMSSKPLAGINHKEYGVTSEGVAVFLEVALLEQGIDPKQQPFTIKITGGPDGDVAGNLMRILFRDHGENVLVVGVADGSGCAEDPAGLDHKELMRLFKEALPISSIDPSSLSAKGVIHRANCEEGVRMRNSMHNRVQADVFVPAGGRPHTMHDGNWRDFLGPDGKPSSPVIVEGANLFLTSGARQSLFEEAKVLIVKDSSANKCGVITSSFEICASMLLEQSEFLEIKEEVVQDTLQRLRELARLEAQLMFREYKSYPGSLPSFSERISYAINSASDAIRGALAGMERGDEMFRALMPLFVNEYLPRKLAEKSASRVDDRIPLDYLRNAFASRLACKMLYSEGINFLECQPRDKLASLGLQYYKEEQKLKAILREVGKMDDLSDGDRQQVIDLLRAGGVRSALHVY